MGSCCLLAGESAHLTFTSPAQLAHCLLKEQPFCSKHHLALCLTGRPRETVLCIGVSSQCVEQVVLVLHGTVNTPIGCMRTGSLEGRVCLDTQVARVRSGVRALPQTTTDGAVPLAGKLPSSSSMHRWAVLQLVQAIMHTTNACQYRHTLAAC